MGTKTEVQGASLTLEQCVAAAIRAHELVYASLRALAAGAAPSEENAGWKDNRAITHLVWSVLP